MYMHIFPSLFVAICTSTYSLPQFSQDAVVIQASQTSSKRTGAGEEEGEEEEEATMVLIPFLPPIRTAPPDYALVKEEGKLGLLKFILHWILFILSFPFIVAFTWTIPNCSENRKWYVVAASFLMAILWIAIISFGMVTLVSRVGCILGIGQFTMGLVVIAVGTSIPVRGAEKEEGMRHLIVNHCIC